MSNLWGILKKQDEGVSVSELVTVSAVTERYATGSVGTYARDRIGMGFQQSLTHARSKLDTGISRDSYRNVLAWDGRLDNHENLRTELELGNSEISDSQIVLSAFRKWKEQSFSRLTGDWALALWDATGRVLYLARDHAGTRTLYVYFDGDAIRWGTHLETLLAWSRGIQISRAYVGCYIAGIELRSLTPYQDVLSLPPGHYFAIGESGVSLRTHWSAAEVEEVVCSSDEDYEQQFLTLLKQAVRRRVGGSEAILAELSGGMDSTGIVCVSDLVSRTEQTNTRLIDTVSYMDDAEVSLGERPYIEITERSRGKTGVHLDMPMSSRTFIAHDASRGRYVFPGADSCTVLREEQFQEVVWSRGYSSLLSGIGGDELLGGIPDPMPELSQLLTSASFKLFLERSFAWSMVDRTPALWTIARSIRFAAQVYGHKPICCLPAWLSPDLRGIVERELDERTNRHDRGHSVGQLMNQRTWWAVMETLPHLFPRLLVRPEYRYPYLDKDLVNFLMAIPREQLVRPNRRRSLMRRALKGIVPDAILERSAKAFQLHGTLRAIRQVQGPLESLFQRSHLVIGGYIASDLFLQALRMTCDGNAIQLRTVLRTVAMELWLQSGSGLGADGTVAGEEILTAH